MELDRPHFRTTSTCTTTSSTSSELFICFSSRLYSSSSMKLTRSILSPARAARDGCAGPVSLSYSLSRRLRTNGSLKGGASPFFTSSAKKRGSGLDNPEPSSPKVTCIGQVRVKSLKNKKKVMQTRSLSTRRSGEVSFRKIEQQGQRNSLHYNKPPRNQECFPNRNHNNQRWAHLPISICEALRSFGSEFSCLFRCKSPCFSTCEKGEEKRNRSDENGCGAVFTRWLVSVNDGECGKRREIELVVGGGDEEVLVEEERRTSMRSSRRHVFEDIEVKDDVIGVKGQNCYEDGREGEEQEKGRVSICIPPKNALLLMRCRSDPMKVAALASRFSWDAHAAPRASNCENGGDLEDEEEHEVLRKCTGIEEFERECGGKDVIYEDGGDSEQDSGISAVCNEEMPIEAKVVDFEMDVGDVGGHEEEQVLEVEMVIEDEKCDGLRREIGAETFVEEGDEEVEVESNMSSFEALLDQENADQGYEECPLQENEQVAENPICHLSSSPESEIDSYSVLAAAVLPEEAPLETLEKDAIPDEENEPKETNQEHEEIRANKFPENEELGIVNLNEESKKEKESPKALPDCLLLMMCEPKLSMEVSKETWVCSTDFIRWLPERPPKQQQPLPKAAKSGGGGRCIHEPVKRRLSTDLKPKHLEKIITDQRQAQQTIQPPRSSCSLPPKAPSMATMIEHKLVNAAAYEPLVLTRCKSEPMRTAASKLMPESFFWKNAMRKLEPHRRATVGAAGVRT